MANARMGQSPAEEVQLWALQALLGPVSSRETEAFTWGWSVTPWPPSAITVFHVLCWPTVTLLGYGIKANGGLSTLAWGGVGPPGPGQEESQNLPQQGQGGALSAAAHTQGPLRFLLQFLCKMGAPRGSTPAQGRITAGPFPLPQPSPGWARGHSASSLFLGDTHSLRRQIHGDSHRDRGMHSQHNTPHAPFPALPP